ncbi:MAG TPA: zinc ribbon domain-containing protein [Pyrinomonadaceae bacterium]|jgi:hypothetical protein|nr:zinc ribbon domain-containing protein [Pyrinomonadaceae bacterium]
MYCSTCGVAIAPGLSYCNYCGAKLSGGEGDNIIKSPEVRPGTLVGAMVFAFVFGLVAITLLLGMMKAVLRLEVGPILAFAGLSFLIMLSLEAVFIRLLLRRRRGAEEAHDTAMFKGPATKELDAAQVGMLPEPTSSVTEHTTRTFEPIHRQKG